MGRKTLKFYPIGGADDEATPDDVAKLIEGLGDKTDEELSKLEESLMERINALSADPSDENLKAMEEIADAVTNVRETISARETDREDRQKSAEEILSKVKVEKVEEAPEPEKAEKPETPSAEETPEVKAEAPAETPAASTEEQPAEQPAEEAAETREPALVTAGAQPTLSELSASSPGRMRPRERNPRVTIVAGADVPGHSAGSTIESWDEVGEALVKKGEALKGVRNINPGARYPVISVKADYPEDRLLTTDDPAGNTAKVSDIVSPQAITASGGLCAPVEVHYGLENVSQAARPLRDSLAKFMARRGGIRFITPPKLTDLVGAIDITTDTQDAAGSPDADKAILTITCGEEVTVQIQAISLRLQIGQFSRMTFPEQFQTWYDLALSQHARRAEGAILDAVSTNSTAITSGGVMGAGRDLLNDYGRFATQYRNRHRMAVNAPLVVWLPHWVVAVFQADYAMQLPGDGLEAYMLTEAWVKQAFAARGMQVTFYQDERAGSGQIFGVQGAGAGLGWITTVEGYMFHPGAHLFLDGGTLDLGVEIRDTTTIATNDLQAFMETFENVAFTGIESLRIRSTICVSGRSAATVEVTCPGEGS